jgi:hypothetical protein
VTVTVGVVPAEARSWYPRLFTALEEAYPVRFVAPRGEDGVGSADAVVVLEGGRAPEGLRVPCLVLESPNQEHGGKPFAVEMSRSARLDRSLNGQRLIEHASPHPVGVRIGPDHDVLASVAGKPVWSCSAGEGGILREHACASLTELEDTAYLRDHLSAGRFWSLLPLAHFLKRQTFGPDRRSGPHAACLVIDDPNVRFPSYRYLRFRELGRDAREHGYHVAVATIPLDLLLPGKRGLQAFREYAKELSLVAHGSDHRRRELERSRDAAHADRIIGTAESRIRKFEESSGVRIERVMCPPHERCGPGILAALFRWNYHALAAAHPFPWDGFAAQRDWRLGGWLPAQLAGGGVPVLPRHPLEASLDDLVFRAFLDQPLIAYCHHTALREGFDSIHSAVARVAELGEVRWMSLGSIARTNALIDSDGAVTTVEIYSRDLHIPRPATDSLRIAIPRIFGGGEATQLSVDGSPLDVELDGSQHVSVDGRDRPDGDELWIRLEAQAPVTAIGPRDLRPRAWPLARRVMTEARDRALPSVRGRRA